MNRFQRLVVFAVSSAAAFTPFGAASGQTRNMDAGRIETRILGQRTWLPGSTAAIRVLVTDHQTGLPLAADVSAELRVGAAGASGIPLFSAHSDSAGTVAAQFRVPRTTVTHASLVVEAATVEGRDHLTEPISLSPQVRLLLTSDKPLYQPGQLIHLRAMAIDQATGRPQTGDGIAFLVEDGRGNKVFRKTAALSRFGIAGTDFQLADEVNLGSYRVTADTPGGSATINVRVERYTLPKFKIEIKPLMPWYLPGQTVTGTLSARYFFGKPVAGAKVSLDYQTFDVGAQTLGTQELTTGADGTCGFLLRLPDTLFGQQFSNGNGNLEIGADVVDSAGHLQRAAIDVVVARSAISVVAVPEDGALQSGLPNKIYLSVATPDGKALPGVRLSVRPADSTEICRGTTDRLGIAEITLTPGSGSTTLAVFAVDAGGRRSETTVPLSAHDGGLLLECSNPMVKAGQILHFRALASASTGTIYLDAILNGHTVLTEDSPLRSGRADFNIPATAAMVGTVQFSAFRILTNENIVRDTRTTVVMPATGLQVRISGAEAEFKPGGTALLRFRVTDGSGNPAPSALGLSMVDESVLSLSAEHAGLARVYYALESSLMRPRYEIHGISPPMLVSPGPIRFGSPEQERAAALVLAAADGPPDMSLNEDSWLTRWSAIRRAAIAVLEKAQARVNRALSNYRLQHGESLRMSDALDVLIHHGYLLLADVVDPWGTQYRPEWPGQSADYCILKSAGPDRRWGTADDLDGEAEPVGGFFGGAGGFRGGPGGLGGAVELPAGVNRREIREEMAVPTNTPADAIGSNGLAAAKGSLQQEAGGGPAPRLRSWFPETLLWQPQLITDDSGYAVQRLTMADSITTWQLNLEAIDLQGNFGSAVTPVRVFQPFFVDVDVPLELTQHDQITLPVAIYNYLTTAQTIRVSMQPAAWFALTGADTRQVTVAAGEVTSVSFTITALTPGSHHITVSAVSPRHSDAVRRTVAVTADGRPMESIINHRVTASWHQTIVIPTQAIDGASSIQVKLYPGALSQALDGLDGLLRMPYGCFEQTSSTTYPNVLVLNYLKATHRDNPAIRMKAEALVNIGYQRLLTFECRGGGFSWFGQEPANQVLTAYGLLEFSDMARAASVDPALISRTQEWLAGRQRQNGSWLEDTGGIAEGIINRQTGALRTTAYVDWALVESGYTGSVTARGADYVRRHLSEAKDAYTLALILNLLVDLEPHGAATGATANRLIGMARSDGSDLWWPTGTEQMTFTGATGGSADAETVGLATIALEKWGENVSVVQKSLAWLAAQRGGDGAWGTTQATVWALRALLYDSEHGAGNSSGVVTVTADGATAATWQLTQENGDVMRTVTLKKRVHAGTNSIDVEYSGTGAPALQVVARWYQRWGAVPVRPLRRAPLSLHVSWDRMQLRTNSIAGLEVTVHNNTSGVVQMPLIDIGTPPGFDVIPDQLDAAVKAGRLSKFTIAGRQVTLYLTQLLPHQTMVFQWQVRARFPLRAQMPDSRVYPYYNPRQVYDVAPVLIEVR